MNVKDEVSCLSVSPDNFLCTLVKGHEGPHKALAADNEVVSSWLSGDNETYEEIGKGVAKRMLRGAKEQLGLDIQVDLEEED